MSNFLSKINVKTALQRNKNKFDLSCNHITTQDFFKMKPVYIHEMIPGEKININMAAFTRLSPLTQPMYGSCRIVNRAFFVPMRTVWRPWNNFITQSRYTGSNGLPFIPSIVPTFTWKRVYDLLFSGSDSAYSVIATAQLTPDVEYDSKRYIFTQRGKVIWNVLQGLGYKLNTADATTDHNEAVSALPLLAFAKLFVDWFSNPAYNEIGNVEKLFNNENSTLTLVSADLANIFNNIYKICYSTDYFTASWDNPVSPNQGGQGNLPTISIVDATVPNGDPQRRNRVSTGASEIGTVSRTPAISNMSGSESGSLTAPASITQYMIDTLHSVTDYVKRMQLVGGRALDRYMAMFGMQLDSAKLDRSVYLGKHDCDIQISDVMQTAPEYGETTLGVGNYSGKGIGYGNGKFEYSTDEYGYLIITSYIEPKINYVDGRPRNLYHLTNMDFFTPDFDALGVQTIRKDELMSNGLRGQYPQGFKANDTFGFTPRYAEYKVALDNVSGDFCLDSKNTSLSGWLLARRYTPQYANLHALPETHNLAFTQADGSEYNSIFEDTTDNQDHFFTIFRFNVTSYAPMKKLYDMYDYANEDGKDMTLSIGGQTVTD